MVRDRYVLCRPKYAASAIIKLCKQAPRGLENRARQETRMVRLNEKLEPSQTGHHAEKLRSDLRAAGDRPG